MPRTTDPQKRHRVKIPVTPDTIDDYFRTYCGGSCPEMEAYISATDAIACEINKIVRRANNFYELKKELLEFHRGRRELIKFAIGGGFSWDVNKESKKPSPEQP